MTATLPIGPTTSLLQQFLGSNRTFLPTSGGGAAVLKDLGRSYFPSGGTKLPGSQTYGSKIDTRLLRAYLPKNKQWSEPRKEIATNELL